MLKKPFFSIIIPTYNRVTVLPRAIRSVLSQAFTDWELIIVDDGSNDGTETVVKNSFLDHRIRYHWQKNKELNGARNTGIELARGAYLLFLDDDDTFLTNHLSVLYEHVVVDSSPLVIRTAMLLKNKKQIRQGFFYDKNKESAVSFLWYQPVNLLSFAFHQSIFETLKFDEQFLLADDFHFLMQLFLKYPLTQIREHTVVYYLHETNRTALYYKKYHLDNKLKAMELLWEKCGSELSRHIPEKSLMEWNTRQLLHFARTTFRQKDKALGWFYFREALKGFTIKQSRSFIRTVIVGLIGV